MKYLEMFKEYKINVEGNTENSINHYIKELNNFFKFLDIQEDKEMLKVSFIDVQSYIAELVKIGNEANTRNLKLTIIKSFYTYLQRDLDKNIDYRILTIRYSKVIKKAEKKWLNPDECKNILLASKGNIRIQTIMAIMITTGARLSDISQIKLDEALKLRGYDKKGNEEYYVKVLGKGNKERYLYLNNKEYDVIGKIRKYVNNKRVNIIKRCKVESDLLFISDNGRPLDHSNIRKSVKHYAMKANIDDYDKVSPHTLRHSFATNLLNNGENIAVVRDAMGHSSISTTNTYVHSNADNIRDAMQG